MHQGVGVTFGRWYELREGALAVLAEPGVFQVRIPHGLVDYPRGKSAMIYYGVASDLRAEVAAAAERWGGKGWLCRHSVELLNRERADLDAALCSLLTRFERRFGSPPVLPT